MRRRHNRRRKNNQRKIIICSLVGLLFIMVVGYSAFQTNLNINVKGNVVERSAADQLIKLVVTDGDGLYKSAYEEGRYIYRGADPDNYITFNNELWRIMSVESDGTLKIESAEPIGDGDPDFVPFDIDLNRESSTSTYCTDPYGCNAWAATDNLIGSPTEFIQFYPYGNPDDSSDFDEGTVIKDCSMNTYLNNTYYNTLSDEAKSYVVEGIFDVSTPGDASDTEDMATNIEQAKQYQWKGKVALMTILEYMQATSNTTCTSLSVAGYTSACWNNNWMMSFDAIEMTISPFASRTDWYWAVYSYPEESYADYQEAWGSGTVRPVLYLRSNITLSGQGTSSSPYTINS